MAFRRRLGELTDMLLRAHLQQRNQAAENDAIGAREAAARTSTQDFQSMLEALKNPQAAEKLAQLPGASPRLQALAPAQNDAFNAAADSVNNASDLEKIPSDPAQAFYTQPGAGPRPAAGDVGPDKPVADINALMGQRRDALKQAILAKATAQAQGPVDVKNANFPNELQQAGDLARANAYNSAMGGEEAAAENEPSILGRDFNKGTQANTLEVDKQKQLNPVLAARAGAEASAKIGPEEELASFRNDLAKDLESYKNDNNVTATTRSMMEGAQMLRPHVKNVTNMATALNDMGYFGPVMSRIRQLGEHAGTVEEFEAAINNDPWLQKDKNIGKFATELGLMASGFGRVHGGARGGGAVGMLKYMKDVLNDNGSLPMFLGRMESVDGYLAGYAAGPKGKQPEMNIEVDPLVQAATNKLKNRDPVKQP